MIVSSPRVSFNPSNNWKWKFKHLPIWWSMQRLTIFYVKNITPNFSIFFILLWKLSTVYAQCFQFSCQTLNKFAFNSRRMIENSTITLNNIFNKSIADWITKFKLMLNIFVIESLKNFIHNCFHIFLCPFQITIVLILKFLLIWFKKLVDKIAAVPFEQKWNACYCLQKKNQA